MLTKEKDVISEYIITFQLDSYAVGVPCVTIETVEKVFSPRKIAQIQKRPHSHLLSSCYIFIGKILLPSCYWYKFQSKCWLDSFRSGKNKQ